MSTRSFICKELQDGTYYGIYCHSDGNLSYNGAMLLDHYSNKEKLDKLLALGDISSLDINVEPDPTKPHSFDYDKRQAGVVVAYGRDRGETGIEARQISLEDAQDSWCEYMYILAQDGNWYYYDLHHKEPKLTLVQEYLDKEYAKLGIPRPKNTYGFFSKEDLLKILSMQTSLEQGEVEM